jgi:hypothetical protein
MRCGLLLSVILLIISPGLQAQDVIWAKKRSIPQNSWTKGVLTDDAGNIYDFGSRLSDELIMHSQVSDTVGSYLSVYDEQGNLRSRKEWKTSFYISAIEYSANRLYFTGSFRGNIVIDGFTLRSRGGFDGFIGEMDLQGRILAIKTFGGRKNDFSFGLTVNPLSQKIFITGGVSDTVYIDNQVIANRTQAVFTASFDKPASLVGFRFYDFETGRDAPLDNLYQKSVGREILTDRNGNIYLLHDREGQSTMDDTPSGRPHEGRYLAKINTAGAILWAKLISGDECYYGEGNQAYRLRINSNGDAYVLKYCGAKYGGEGSLLRFNSTDGFKSWTYSNGSEFGYYDIFVDKEDALFLVGNEGGIPYGEEHRYGHDIVRKFDQSNFTVWETRLFNVRTDFILKDPSENIVVAGIFREETVTIGNSTLAGKYGDGFMAKLTDNSMDITYLSGSDIWRYLDNGTNQGSGWRFGTYNDAAWKSGRSQLGYGDGDEATVVGYGPSSSNKYITTYFRKLIQVSNPSRFSHFELNLLRDDGAVVYINGVEVLRSNMPAGSISYTTRAVSPADGSSESAFIKYTIPSSRFVNGSNLIAVEIHQSSSTSSDISFNLKLKGVAGAMAPSNCSAAGIILREYWLNVQGDHVSQIPLNTTPSGRGYLSSFEGPRGFDDNYGSRIRGYICPPVTGNYTFWISSDDDAELWLSPDDNPSGKVRIAYVSGWTYVNEWEKYPSQRSASVFLKQGVKYYVEALHKEALGDDHIEVGWRLPDGTLERPIPGARLAPASATTASQLFVVTKSSWKYLDNGSNQGTAWTSPLFNDGSWKTGNAELGYGDGDETTLVGYGPDKYNKYITTYFRKAFTVNNAADFSSLELLLRRDDGAVVYLNGNEIFRSNMPSGIIYYNTPAANYADGASETAYIKATLSSQYLVNGTNIIAVEVHQSSRTSSDISFDLELRGSDNSARLSETVVNDNNLGLEPENRIVSLSVYPNPFTKELAVSYQLNEEAPTSLEMFDQLGRKVLVMDEASLDQGTRTYRINTGALGLTSGIYLLRFNAGAESFVRKVVYQEQ